MASQKSVSGECPICYEMNIKPTTSIRAFACVKNKCPYVCLKCDHKQGKTAQCPFCRSERVKWIHPDDKPATFRVMCYTCNRRENLFFMSDAADFFKRHVSTSCKTDLKCLVCGNGRLFQSFSAYMQHASITHFVLYCEMKQERK